jgi:hypothetical protein
MTLCYYPLDWVTFHPFALFLFPRFRLLLLFLRQSIFVFPSHLILSHPALLSSYSVPIISVLRPRSQVYQ